MKKYEQVENYIKDKIQTGNFHIGSKIPSEDELIEKLHMSRNPVRRALENLVQDGIIYKIQGSGSFVKDITIPDPIKIYAILPSESMNLETRIIEGMRAALEDSSYKNIHLILQRPGKNTFEQIEILNMLPHYHKGGMIILPVVSSDRPRNRLLVANVRKLEKIGYPVIQVDNYISEYHGNYIITNNRKAAYDMTTLLFEHGHRKIALLYQHIEKPSNKLRIKGVKDCFLQRNISQTNLFRFDMSEQVIDRDFVKTLMDRGVTAVFGFECSFIRDLFLTMTEAGLSVPEDLSLCSFDNHCYTSLDSNFFTAVVQQCDTIGYYAIQLLLDMIEKKTTGRLEMLINANIVKRKSVGKV